jgi:hypothetical protein
MCYNTTHHCVACVSPAAGGTLIEAMANSGGRLPERQVAIKVALPLLTALQQLHSTGIVHRCAAGSVVGGWPCLPGGMLVC